MRTRSHYGIFFFYFGNVVHEVRERTVKERQHWKQSFLKRGLYNASLVLRFGLSSPSWAEEWKRLSAGMSGVPSNGAGLVTGQWERGLQSGGLIFSWWTQLPVPQCSLIARAELAYGPCLEGPNDRTNSAWREKGGDVGRRWLRLAPSLFISLALDATDAPETWHYLQRLTHQVYCFRMIYSFLFIMF